MTDFVVYGDTDSLYVSVKDLIGTHIDEDVWNGFSDEKKIKWTKEIAEVVSDYVNERVFQNLQLDTYGSNVRDFKIVYIQEAIAKSFLITSKKKYAFHCVLDEGRPVDDIKVKGLEIVRGDSSEVIKPLLKEIVEMVLRRQPDKEIQDRVDECRRILKKSLPEEIAVNVSANNIEKYVNGYRFIKGTPYHIKGVANYRLLLEVLGIDDKYENIYSGLKVKVVYLKPNKYNIEVLSFERWPKEFYEVVSIDYEKMIERYFIKKLMIIFKPIRKESLLMKKTNTDLFFM